MHRAWYTLLCVASANGGQLPPVADIALRLRVKPEKIASWIAALVDGGLIDNVDGIFKPHNWDRRQYKTDARDGTGAARQRKHREKQRDELDELRSIRDRAHSTLRNGVSNGRD